MRLSASLWAVQSHLERGLMPQTVRVVSELLANRNRDVKPVRRVFLCGLTYSLGTAYFGVGKASFQLETTE